MGAPGGAGCSADRRKDPSNYVCTGMGCGGGDRHASRRADLEICARGIREEDLVSRREFLKLGAVGVAAAVSLLIASCGGGGGGKDTDGGGY